jgi:hypothetical protein
MNVRTTIFSAIALAATSATFADAGIRQPAEPRAEVRRETMIQDLGERMRALLAAVTPEISLPKIELTLPSLERGAR